MYAILLAAAAACCCLLLLTPKLLKGVRFLFDCRQAKSFYLESLIPGPPAATSILGMHLQLYRLLSVPIAVALQQ